jgi:hypothetical protein
VPRIAMTVLLVAVVLGLAAPEASATPSGKLDTTLAQLWTKVFETPAAQNPFGSGGSASACWDLGGTVAPFAPEGVSTCTVKPGTKIFVTAASFECSTFEGNGTTEAELLKCARQGDAQTAPSVTLDSKTVAVAEVETGGLKIVLPADNIFGDAAGSTGLSVAHGWVALLNPQTPGTHTIVIRNGATVVTTTILVKPGRRALEP